MKKTFSITMILLLALVYTSCTATSGTKSFPAVEIPYSGEELPSEFWEQLEVKEDAPLPAKSKTTSWILPLNIYSKSANVLGPDTLLVSNRVYNGIGFPLFLLPLRFKHATYIYEPGMAEPAEGEWVSWTLFWADSGSTPEQVEPEMNAWGIPLFFSSITSDDPKQEIDIWQSLWSLGPLYYSSDVEMPSPENPNEMAQANVTLFTPLMLGGLPGAILWFDGTVRNNFQDSSVHIESHGPLMGLLGYIMWNNRAGEIEQNIRFVGGGALWMDLASETAEPTDQFSAHGPLWSMFGWGKKDGKDAVRLFWFPIVLPGQ